MLAEPYWFKAVQFAMPVSDGDTLSITRSTYVSVLFDTLSKENIAYQRVFCLLIIILSTYLLFENHPFVLTMHSKNS